MSIYSQLFQISVNTFNPLNAVPSHHLFPQVHPGPQMERVGESERERGPTRPRARKSERAKEREKERNRKTEREREREREKERASERERERERAKESERNASLDFKTLQDDY